MQQVTRLTGTGWLRTHGYGSATATYRIDVYRRVTGPRKGETVTQGVLAAESWALVVARIDGAVLVLDTGEPLEIRLRSLSTSDTTAGFTVVGQMPALPKIARPPSA